MQLTSAYLETLLMSNKQSRNEQQNEKKGWTAKSPSPSVYIWLLNTSNYDLFKLIKAANDYFILF